MVDKKEAKKEESSRAKCDNHPQRLAVIVTDGGGVHSEVKLCEECAPQELLDQLKDDD
jgi:hypothetical protein